MNKEQNLPNAPPTPKKELIRKLQTQLDEWKQQLQEFEEKTDQIQQDVKNEYDERVKDIQQKITDVEHHLKKIRGSAGVHGATSKKVQKTPCMPLRMLSKRPLSDFNPRKLKPHKKQHSKTFLSVQ